MRMIIEASDTTQAISGVVVIGKYQALEYKDPCIFAFSNGENWLVKKTKTGYSARMEMREEAADAS